MRLDIPAGTAVRFEPGQTREVKLVALAGTRTVYGFRQEVMGKLEKAKPRKIMTSGLAQARPSRSQRCYRGWDQDQISFWCDAGDEASAPGRFDLGDLSHSVEPNASDLKIMILQKPREASESVRWRR